MYWLDRLRGGRDPYTERKQIRLALFCSIAPDYRSLLGRSSALLSRPMLHSGGVFKKDSKCVVCM